MDSKTPDQKGKEKIQNESPLNRKGIIKYALIIVALLLVVLGALAIYQNVYLPAVTKPSPTPLPTAPVWQSKSEKNVNEFMQLWIAGSEAAKSDEYALKAKDLLSNEARTALPLLKDNQNQTPAKLFDQLTLFVGQAVPKTYLINDITQVDTLTVKVKVFFDGNLVKARIFTTKSEGDNWLINQVESWEQEND